MGVLSGTTVYELSDWAASAKKLKKKRFEIYGQKTNKNFKKN